MGYVKVKHDEYLNKLLRFAGIINKEIWKTMEEGEKYSLWNSHGNWLGYIEDLSITQLLNMASEDGDKAWRETNNGVKQYGEYNAIVDKYTNGKETFYCLLWIVGDGKLKQHIFKTKLKRLSAKVVINEIEKIKKEVE